MIRMLALALLFWGCGFGLGWSVAHAQERASPRVCHAITDADSFIKSAAMKSAAMTIVRAADFGKAAGYKPPLIAVFILPDDNTLITVGRQPQGFSECFTSVHEDGETWEAVQKFFGRGA